MTAALATAPAVTVPHRNRGAAASTPPPAQTALPYLEPVPTSEPPFDDDLDRRPGTVPVARSTAGTVPPESTPAWASGLLTTRRPAHPNVAAVRRGTVVAPRPGPLSTPGHRTRIAASGVPPWSSESDVGIRRTSTQSLPPAARSGQVFARALVEVLSGRRPLAQLRVHCAPDIYAGLLARPVPPAISLPHLLNVRVCEPADGVAEVSAAFKRAQRVRAIAFRLQGLDGRWRITALEVG